MIKNHDKAVLQGLNGLRDVRIFYFASSDNNPPIQDVSDEAASSKTPPSSQADNSSTLVQTPTKQEQSK